MSTLRSVLVECRPHQWTKNLFVFAALIFSKELQNGAAVLSAALVFVAFCLLASVIYIWNDIGDRESDRKHPTKCKRPIASGALPVPTALAVAVLFLVAAAGIVFLIARDHPWFLVVPIAYVANNVLYTHWLKHVVLLDAFSISFGFVLRIYGGGVAIDKPISEWLILCTLFVSLFLALCKRRAELTLLEGRSGEHRAILEEYSPYFLDQMIALLTACTILSYAVYTVHPTTQHEVATGLHWSVPFVIYGVCRYLYLVHQKEQGGNPTRAMLRDRAFLVNGVLWTLVVMFFIYRSRVGF